MIRRILLNILITTVLLLTLSLALPAPKVSAQLNVDGLTKCDIEALIKAHPAYDNCEVLTSCGGSSAVSPIGGNNLKAVYDFLRSRGLSPVQAAAVMGNLSHESGGGGKDIYTNRSNPDSGAYGIAQWLGGRLDRLKERAQQSGKPLEDLGLQLDYLWWELSDPESDERRAYNVLEEVLAMDDLEQIVIHFEDEFERSEDVPGSPAMNNRISYAKNFLEMFGSDAVTPGGNVICANPGQDGGQIIAGYSLPVDRKYYDDHPDWFTKPHHDYPAADIPVGTNTPIYSMSAGKIISAPTGGACGIGIVVDAGGGVQFIYCHGLDGGSVPGARLGDVVRPGQLIMHADNTGRSFGPHLHLGIRINGQDRCPQELFVGIAKGSPPDIMSLASSGCSY